MSKNTQAINENITNQRWIDIENTYGAEVAQALRALYNYYDARKIAEWIVSLYSPEHGGFYYCKSAKETEGYLPDLESTAQALTILAEIGAIPTDKLNDMIPESIRHKILDFVIEKQSPADGHFFHPQWPQGKENLPHDRYGRDVGNAWSVLRRVKCDRDGDGIDEPQYPKYCMVTGKKCKLHEGTDEVCHFPIGGVGVTEEEASDAVPKEAYDPLKPVYTSKEEFLEWLKRYSATIHQNSGRAHQLAALSDEIQYNGYADTFIDFLDEMQRQLFDEQVSLGEHPTGIWQRAIDYRAVWGVYKYVFIYNKYGRAVNIKYAPYMIDTCLEVIKLPPIKNYAYNDLMNQWSSITAVIGNVRKHHGDAEADKLLARVRENAVSLIKNSLEKMLPFKMEDCSFCNHVSGVTTPIIYGVPIAVGGLAEGNVNSTHILLCMYFSICAALGCPSVPLADTSLGTEVVKALSSL